MKAVNWPKTARIHASTPGCPADWPSGADSCGCSLTGLVGANGGMLEDVELDWIRLACDSELLGGSERVVRQDQLKAAI